MSVTLQEQYDKIYRYCYFKIRNKEAAEDLTQKTFLNYFSQKSYINKGKPLAYLYTISKNLCIDFYRKNNIEQSLDAEVKADDAISSFETNYVVKQAVSTLQNDLQEILLLRFANELGIGQIAEIMGISRFSVYRKLNAAIDKLKIILSEEDFS